MPNPATILSILPRQQPGKPDIREESRINDPGSGSVLALDGQRFAALSMSPPNEPSAREESAVNTQLNPANPHAPLAIPGAPEASGLRSEVPYPCKSSSSSLRCPINSPIYQVELVECVTRMEQLHGHIPPFVAASACSEAAADASYTVESAPSDNDTPVNGLMFFKPLNGSSAEDASPRILSAHTHPTVPAVGRSAAVRLDEDKRDAEIQNDTIRSCEGDPGEDRDVFGSSPCPSYSPETDAQYPDPSDTRRCGTPDQRPTTPRRGEEWSSTVLLGASAGLSMDSRVATDKITTGTPPNDSTPVQYGEVPADEASLPAPASLCEDPVRLPQGAHPASTGQAERQMDSDDRKVAHHEVAPRSATPHNAERNGCDDIIRPCDFANVDGDRPSDVVVSQSQNTPIAVLRQEDVPADVRPMFDSTIDIDGHTYENMSAPSAAPTLGFDSLSSRTGSSIAPSSPRSELGISAQFSDVGDDTRSEVSAASQVPAAPSSPRSISNEDFFTPALRTLWKLETPVTPTDTSKVQPSPSTPALTVGRTDNGLDSNIVTPVVPHPGGMHQEQTAIKAENATFSVRIQL